MEFPMTVIDAEFDGSGQRLIEGIIDEEYERIHRMAIKARADADDADKDKKHATKVAKTKEIAMYYFGVRSVIEQARVKSLEGSGQFAVIDSGDGPTVENIDTWDAMSGTEKSEAVLYGIFEAGSEVRL